MEDRLSKRWEMRGKVSSINFRRNTLLQIVNLQFSVRVYVARGFGAILIGRVQLW